MLFHFLHTVLKTVLLLEEISEELFSRVSSGILYQNTFELLYFIIWGFEKNCSCSRLPPSMTIFTIKPPCSEGPAASFLCRHRPPPPSGMSYVSCSRISDAGFFKIMGLTEIQYQVREGWVPSKRDPEQRKPHAIIYLWLMPPPLTHSYHALIDLMTISGLRSSSILLVSFSMSTTQGGIWFLVSLSYRFCR